MNSKLINAVKAATNIDYTENGALTRKTTMSALYDLFAMGAAYRTRSESDCIVLFQKAFEENPIYALKCLFYLRDTRGGQGERRFFRTVIKYMADANTEAMRRNLKYVPEFGRWDDLYAFVGTKLEEEAFIFIEDQLVLDLECKTPSLCAKWLKSENTSSKESRELGRKTREALKVSPRVYRKILSNLRARINVVERLMSAGEWDKIEFDKIPSKAGLVYRNAFARHDIERMRADKNAVAYKDFVQDKDTKVNAKALYPYEVVAKAVNFTGMMRGWYWNDHTEKDDPVERAAINKYWDNLEDYFNGASFNGLCVCDTSGSMWGTDASAPINVAIAISLYCAERAKGPFANTYISFSSRPQLIETYGIDFVDKVKRIYSTNLCENTNIEATFDMLLNAALKNHCTQEDLPQNIIIISDMEFDAARGRYVQYQNKATLMENISHKWQRAGYKMPHLIFWCVDNRHDNIPMKEQDGITFVSGMSPTIFTQIMKGKTGYDLMMDKLNEARYECIH